MNSPWKPTVLMIVLIPACLAAGPAAGDYVVVDTGQSHCYDESAQIACPGPGRAFHGQDAQYDGTQPRYTDNGDGTVTDLETGLMWQQTPDLFDKPTYDQAVREAGTFALAGYDDWRLPSIKELYSLIHFDGSSFQLVPYIDTDYFDFRFGDPGRGERTIDAQYWSSTEYVGTTMNGDATVFGVNFADGRIKGYPRDRGPGGSPMTQFVRYVRGNPDYGVNDFIDDGDGTVTDEATGLMWTKADSGAPMDWKAALAHCEGLEAAGHDDWRLPNPKELQSIVDYSRAPDAVDPARRGPAIDPVFDLTETESWHWTGTTHLDGPAPDVGVYVCFGQAWGWMERPPLSGNYVLQNVHGAGAQRSDPKSGDPRDWPHGRGPQGDVIRIFNYVRCVRDAEPIGPELDPIPDVKANGSDGPLFLTPGDNITVTVALDAGAHVGERADWWVLADTPFGPFHYNLRTGQWRRGVRVTYQGPLIDLAPPMEVLNAPGLPGGIYVVRFGVDLTPNRLLDPDDLYEDTVEVSVAGRPAPAALPYSGSLAEPAIFTAPFPGEEDRRRP